LDTHSATTYECFALLDDCEATVADRRSRLYSGHAGTLVCRHANELPAFWDALQQALRKGQFALALLSYELGAEMHGVLPREAEQSPSQVLLFDRCEHLSSDEVVAWLAARAPVQERAGIAHVRPSVN
jgi:para-aminobenzoate synthetase / 4-amino-4-deoxychorismate lyase